MKNQDHEIEIIAAQNVAEAFELMPSRLKTKQGEDGNEEELLELLSEQIAQMMVERMSALMQLMYRFDVDEKQVRQALSPLNQELPSMSLAKIVLERQKQRLYTKKHVKTEFSEDMEDMAW